MYPTILRVLLKKPIIAQLNKDKQTLCLVETDTVNGNILIIPMHQFLDQMEEAIMEAEMEEVTMEAVFLDQIMEMLIIRLILIIV